MPRCRSSFLDFAKPLERELPGHGITPVPEAAYTVEDLSIQLPQILMQNGIAKAHVAGISLGGLIAQHFAATQPGRVDRLLLVDTTPRYDDELRHLRKVRADAARTQGVGALIEGLLPVWFSAECLVTDNEAVRYVRSVLARTPGEGYALACEALAAANVGPLVGHIQAPTMVVCGEYDIPSFLNSACWLAADVVNAQLCWIPGTRHASILEAPDHALRLMEEFFSP